MLRPLVTAAAALLLTAGPLAAQPRLAPDRAALRAEALADRLGAERRVEAEATRRASEAVTDAARRRAAALAVPAWYAAARGAGRAVVTVNTTDGGNDGTCGTDPADALEDCSLLEALDLANADPEADVVAFDPAVFGGGATIAPSDTPTITTPVTLDGTANGLAPGDVTIDGPDAGQALLVSGDGASGSVVRGLTLVSASAGLGISGADRVTVQGSFIGTNPAGEDRGNASIGIVVYDASETQIGGVAVGAGNTIGFNREGIEVFSQASAPAVGTRILGNHIGTTAGGADIRNTQRGVRLCAIEGADLRGTEIGGVEPGAANTLAFNGTDVQLLGAVSTRVVGNYIGTNAAGDVLGSKEGTGIDAQGGADTVIGGTAAGAANVIGAKGAGIFLFAEPSSRVEGNFVGTNAAADDLGNGSGIVVTGLGDVVIGGTEAGAGNTVGFNAEGLVLGASQLRVEGNHIGVNAAGDDLGNGIGIFVFGYLDGASTRIGGTTPESANVIGANGTGVVIGSGSEAVALLGNRIDGNDALGIDLAPEDTADGVTPNDPGDGDDGPNGLQNFPVVTGVAPGEPVAFTLDSTPATTFRIEAFAGDAPDASSHGEGARFLGAVEVTTDDAGAATGAVPTTALGGGEWVTTTATPLAATASGFGGTSEFSEAVYLARVATAEAPPSGVALAVYPNPAADRITVVLSVTEPGPVRVALLDVLGREVAEVYEGHPTGEVRAEVDGRRLAPGTYVVRAEGAGGVARQPVTVVR